MTQAPNNSPATSTPAGTDAPVSAPGKAFLIGEYAVLDGAAALVTAVDVRAIAHASASREEPTAVVRCANARVSSFLAARGGEPNGDTVEVETGGFTMGHRKLGLGSSAAVAASVVGYRLAQAGLDPADPDLTEDTLALALAAHSEAQGGRGSGADVAAAVLGGTIRFQDGKATRVDMPQWLEMRFVDAGAPAVTSSFVAQVKRAAKERPAAYADAIGLLRQASHDFSAALSEDAEAGFAQIQEAVALHNRGLGALQELSGAPILTDPIGTILREAEADGVAAKPSGAGGGDMVVVFADDGSALDRFAERLRREHGIATLGELHGGAPGVRAEEHIPTNSRLAGFFKLSIDDRRQQIAERTGLALERFSALDAGALDMQRANHMIENVVGTFELPLAIATNFRINGRDVLVPMCVEEASVVAAASNAAKMIRAGGGFAAHSDPPWMIAQIQLNRPDAGAPVDQAAATLNAAAADLLALADAAHPRLVARGGGARELEVRALSDDMLAVHVLVDCKDAMGANLLNTVAEHLAPRLEALCGWQAGLRILSNLADRRRAHVSARIPPDALATAEMDGAEVVDLIVNASRFAELDPYRAATHNKGIMNGVDAVVLATGNDWRAMEASAHAYAARGGKYGPLGVWRKGEDGWLEGQLSMPAAVGIVGGATKVHPVARLALEILRCRNGRELGQVMAAAGLASNLAALRALATDGIQRGHMALHARSIAMEGGATADEVETLAAKLIADGEIKAERARALLQDMRKETR